LDLDAVVWLEGWLQRYPGTLMVISHDRELLDAVTRVTLHLEQGRLTRYGASYTRFEQMRAEQLQQQQTAYLRQQERIAHLQRFIDRFRRRKAASRRSSAWSDLRPCWLRAISVSSSPNLARCPTRCSRCRT
jgi:ATP-binding cassette subfamily F protein 3